MRQIALTIVFFATVLIPSCDSDDPPADAKVFMDAAPMCTGTIAYLADCTMGSECVSCLCKPFGHEMYCTMPCTVPTDCPAPATNCVANFCKR